MGWWFEDYTVGAQLESPGRTVTEADVMLFAGLTGDAHPLHTDARYAATTRFGERIAHGLLGLGIAFGLLGRGGVFEPTLLALLEVRAWRFLAPVRLGETVHAHATVAAVRPSASRPDRGLVTLGVRLLTGDGVEAQRGELVLLVQRRSAAVAADGGT